MRIEAINGSDGVLTVRCAGVIGIGSKSSRSMRPVRDAVTGWMDEHPDQAVCEVVLDFRYVDYRWGDAPVSSLLPLLTRGVRRFHFVASDRNAPALESLLSSAKVPWFSVVRVDALQAAAADERRGESK